LLLVGCGPDASSVRTPPEGQLANLPRVPASPALIVFPPALQGLTFRVEPRFDGHAPGDPAMADTALRCVASFERWMGAMGWSPVRDPSAPVDLVIEEHCAARMSIEARGDVIELKRPAEETVAVVVFHDGAEVVSVPRGPTDYVCESNVSRGQMRKDCTTRAELWGQANIMAALVASEPLAQLAQQISAARHAR
jgi:hypothetical protein